MWGGLCDPGIPDLAHIAVEMTTEISMANPIDPAINCGGPGPIYLLMMFNPPGTETVTAIYKYLGVEVCRKTAQITWTN